MSKIKITLSNITEETKKGLPKIDLQPKGDRVIVLPLDGEEKVGRIIIPDTAKEKPQKGLIIATGPGTEEAPMTVQRGDVIVYGKYAGSEYDFDQTTFLIMRIFDIQADVVKPY